jgi:hypothetical protein
MKYAATKNHEKNIQEIISISQEMKSVSHVMKPIS